MVIDIRTKKKNGEKLTNVYKDYEYTGITLGSFKQTWSNQNWKNIIV